jgi:hypothetical protein
MALLARDGIRSAGPDQQHVRVAGLRLILPEDGFDAKLTLRLEERRPGSFLIS